MEKGTTHTYTSSTTSFNPSPGVDNNKVSWQKVEADESCIITAYTYPEYNRYGDVVSNQQTQRSVITREGDDNMYNQSGGVGSTGRNFNDDYDSIRIQTVPSAGANEMQYHINAVSQVPLNATDPKSIGSNDMIYYDKTNKVRPCPGGTAYFNSKSGVRCIYPKSASALRTLHGATKASNMDTMYTSLVETFCADSENVFENPGGGTCLATNAGQEEAIEYCSVDKRIKGAAGAADGGDENCSADLTSLGSNYAAVAANYCNTSIGRADTFCKCHNVTNGVCDTDSTAAGCAKKKETFDKLVDATPSDQKDVWSGMESCFGRVCTGTGVFIPANVNQNCDKSVNVCIQNIDIGSLTDSNIQATCDIDAGGDSPSVSTPALESAQTELEEAEAAVARGDPGAQERLDAAREALEEADEDAEETGFKAYIPKSLDGLKNNQKQQIGAGVAGALVLGCMMMLLLLVVGASGGGGGGPVKRRFR